MWMRQNIKINMFLLCSKTKIPDKLPESLQNVVEELRKSKNKEECLRRAYDVLSAKYRGYKFRTYLKLHEHFIFDVERLWKKSGFLHCTNFNYLLRILLIQSGFFKSEDIIKKWTLLYYISPHQYLKIKINDQEFVNVDLWGKIYGIKLGDYMRGFHIKS